MTGLFRRKGLLRLGLNVVSQRTWEGSPPERSVRSETTRLEIRQFCGSLRLLFFGFQEQAKADRDLYGSLVSRFARPPHKDHSRRTLINEFPFTHKEGPGFVFQTKPIYADLWGNFDRGTFLKTRGLTKFHNFVLNFQ